MTALKSLPDVLPLPIFLLISNAKVQPFQMRQLPQLLRQLRQPEISQVEEGVLRPLVFSDEPAGFFGSKFHDVRELSGGKPGEGERFSAKDEQDDQGGQRQQL